MTVQVFVVCSAPLTEQWLSGVDAEYQPIAGIEDSPALYDRGSLLSLDFYSVLAVCSIFNLTWSEYNTDVVLGCKRLSFVWSHRRIWIDIHILKPTSTNSDHSWLCLWLKSCVWTHWKDGGGWWSSMYVENKAKLRMPVGARMSKCAHDFSNTPCSCWQLCKESWKFNFVNNIMFQTLEVYICLISSLRFLVHLFALS